MMAISRAVCLVAGTFVAAHAFGRGGPIPAIPARDGQSVTARGVERRGPATYGTSIVNYYSIDASEMTPMTSDITYSSFGDLGQFRYATSSGGITLIAPLHLPAGALLTSIELDFYDASSSDNERASLYVCNYSGENCTLVLTPDGCADTVATVCSPNLYAGGYFFAQTDLTANAITIDNYSHRYVVGAGSLANDGSEAIGRMVIGYVLQVSPAPGSPTFNDVPVSDFGFQYIEALFQSGITGGCGGGKFCPDSPVTRRQMAIFLAKALGLEWQ